MSGPSRILISGATGFVGRYLRAAIVSRLPHARVLGMAGRRAEAADGLVFADLLDRERIDTMVAEFRPDAVVHLAGQASVSSSLQDQGLTWAVNLGGTLNLATALCAHAPDATLLFASSAEVYGAAFLAGMAKETTALQPMTPYAKSKVLAEQMLAEMLPSTSRLVVARPFNHTGPGQSTTFVLPSFVEQVAQMEMGRRPRRLEVGNLNVAREFLDVRDVVEAYIRLIEVAPQLPARFTCNIATGAPLLLSARVARLRELSEVDFDIVVGAQRVRPVDLPIASGDPSLLRAVTGWMPKIAFDTTLRDLLAAARERERSSAL